MLGRLRDILPESLRENAAGVWLVIIAALVVASVDWWWWESDARIFGWLPAWILWAVALQFALAGALYQFGKRWRR